VLGNHDETRFASRLGPHGARLAAMLLLTLRGTPTLYYGDEIGMTDVPISPEEQQDPWGKRVPGLGRDPCRTPMQWDDSIHAGCSPPATKKTWLPLGESYQTVNVNSQLQDPKSLLTLYRKLLAHRKSSPSLQVGDYSPVEGLPVDCFAYLRQEEGFSSYLVVLNFSPENMLLNLEKFGTGKIILSTHLDRDEPINLNRLIIQGGEGVLIELHS